MTQPKRAHIRILPLVTLIVLAVIGLYGLGKYVRGILIEPLTPVLQLAAPAVTPSPVALNTIKMAAPGGGKPVQDDPWKVFRESFGSDLQVEWGTNGRATGIRGVPGKGERAGPDFKSADSRLAIARAREILEAAHDLLGLDEDLPLSSPVARGGDVSAQVYFQESYDGVPLAPVGGVTVDLGAQGEVLNIHSDYVRDVKVVNERKLNPDQTRSAAIAAIPDQASSLTTVGGNPVVWVSRTPDGTATGKYAYEYNVQGRQVIVDAANSEILFRRDRRQF
jgi:hypothetical protein